jgi:photosystem II stability/assembly factor-like uncharacterized protein
MSSAKSEFIVHAGQIEKTPYSLKERRRKRALLIAKNAIFPLNDNRAMSRFFLPILPLALGVAFLVAQTPPVSDASDSPVIPTPRFRELGPARGGRVTAVGGHAARPNVFFMGASGGGLWRSDDYGQSWRNVSDGYFASPSIGAIAIAPSQPETLYVGTGSDALRGNVIAGKGVYKSSDGGRRWTHLGLERAGHIGAVLVHPQFPDNVFVAAIGQAFAPNPERGVFRSHDGGATWEKVLYLSDTLGFVDLEMAPDNPDLIYAAAWRAERKPWTIVSGGHQGGIYKSENGGDTWRALTRGLPRGLIGKIDLAVSPAKPRRVYALVEAPAGQGGLYRSEDYGENWALISTKKELLERPFYFCNVYAHPANADVVFVGSTYLWRSDDGGRHWRRVSTPHLDNHDLWINPTDTAVWIQANDGGANVSRDGGRTWSTQYNQPTAELYQVELDDQYPYWLYAGQQDNTAIALPSLPPYPHIRDAADYWLDVGGCETGPVVPKPGAPHFVYTNCKGRFGVFDKRSGQEKQYFVGAGDMYGHNPADLTYRFQRIAPIHISPHDAGRVYHASQYLHLSTDEGLTWKTISPDLTAFEADKQVISGGPITRDITGEEFYSAISAVSESPSQAGLIWVGANDGPIHRTTDGGQSWVDVTPADLPPGGRVNCLTPSPHAPQKVYAAILRYQLGDERPYFYRSDDYGESWSWLSDGANGIPGDCPARVLREDPNRPGLLYAGTACGFFISFDDGAVWHAFQGNLPLTPITDIKIFRGDLVLSTMGRGFWILDDLSPWRQWTPLLVGRPAHLIQPRDAIRYRYRSSREIPSYPDARVAIDYYLAQAPKATLSIDILDERDSLLVRFHSLSLARSILPPWASDMDIGTPDAWGAPLPSARLGFNRFFWNFRLPGPRNADTGRHTPFGPLAAPGDYKVRLTVDSLTFTQTLRLLPDPRVLESGVTIDDMKTQSELARKVLALENQAIKLTLALRRENANAAQRATFQELRNALLTPPGPYPQPMLLDQIRYLASMIDQADQRPGRDAYKRYETLKMELNSLLEKWIVIKGESEYLNPLADD